MMTGLLIQYSGFGQTEALVKLDTNAMLIGDHNTLEVRFYCPKDFEVSWPVLRDTISTEIEILRHTEPQSELTQNSYDQVYYQSFTITSFDSGFLVVPPIRIHYKKPGDTTLHYTESEATLLKVNSIPVNMEEEIKDIKDPLSAPFTFKEALPYILILLAIGLITLGIIYYLKKRKKAEPVFKAPVLRKVPPYKDALDAFESLRYKKLWQSGQIKQYHTELTDIIREYLSANFSIHALEYTTDEIMDALNSTSANVQAKEKLHRTLMMADLVKFAKMQPLPLEHDGSLNNAIDFVNETKHLETKTVGSSDITDSNSEDLKGIKQLNEDVTQESSAEKEVNDV